MADWGKAPRDFVMLVRILAIAGGLRAIAMTYYGLTSPDPISPAEAAARAERVQHLADQGEAGLAAGYVAKADLVARAAERCSAASPEDGERSGDCRLARLWLDRYRQRTEEVMARPEGFPAAVRAAAQAYDRAERSLAERAERAAQRRATASAGS